MADYKTIETGNADPRGFTLVAKTTGNPITAGTVNYYLKALTGANAGKWWRDSDQTWQVAETGNAMTHQADGHWSRTLAASPWTDGAEFLEYAKESGDLHIPVSRWLKAAYTPSANSARRVDLGFWLGVAPLALSAQRVQAEGAAGATPEQLWAYASRTLTQSAAQVTSAVVGAALTGLRGDKLVFNLTGVGSLAGRSKLWFMVKSDPARDSDDQAVLSMTEAGGLLRLNGVAYATAADGSIVVTDEATGAVTITLKAAASKLLPVRNGMSYDLQILVSGEPVTRISGTFNVTADVTQAVS